MVAEEGDEGEGGADVEVKSARQRKEEEKKRRGPEAEWVPPTDLATLMAEAEKARAARLESEADGGA